MTYQRILDAADLPPQGPPSGRAREKFDLDFKQYADSKFMAEHAKDVAAFANAVGGVLLIGADDNSGTNLVFNGIRGQSFADVKKIYEGAAQMCSPSPAIDVVPITVAGVELAAVNVDPFIEGVVGSPGETDGHWRFPLRIGSTTNHLRPEALPMYMSPKIRGRYLALSQMPTHTGTHKLWSHRGSVQHIMGVPLDAGDLAFHEVTKKWVDLARNAVQLAIGGSGLVNIPLTEVDSVWVGVDGEYQIRVAGRIDQARKPWAYVPVMR